MVLVFDDIFSWEGWGGKLRLCSGKCRLRIFDLKQGEHKGIKHLRPIVVIVTDVPDSPLSVRSCSGHIATTVTKTFNIDPSRMFFVEYYPAVIYGEKGENTIPERFDAVEFSWYGDKALKPKWRTLKPPILTILRKLLEEQG
ncbi:MAG: hypothetical protein JRH18_03370 [Deltaproteobacteria bacterium]|nr:hypothetical protein [Deltaproteobacteria bacterium]MBW1961497.1 hypothetical protein [Deltaproteobacteria bacterium]MBW1994890.1 hypothetical protein [Deltaproteobacteria bacterium]MBW2150689.1 hypothetical protein [Deltaproteobacteria bacterium]